MTRGVSQLYLSLGDPNADGTIAVRLYFKPYVLLIWIGAVIMFVGGGLSLSDRRLRVGAPRPAKGKNARRPCSRRSERREVAPFHPLRDGDPRSSRRSMPFSPTRCCRTRRWKRARASCRKNCAAWCARISRSTIPRHRSRAICAFWCASGSRPATAISGARFSGGPLRRIRAAQAAAVMAHDHVVGDTACGAAGRSDRNGRCAAAPEVRARDGRWCTPHGGRGHCG